MGDCGVGDIGGRIVVFAFFFLFVAPCNPASSSPPYLASTYSL